MNINDLKNYYNQQEAVYKKYLDEQLSQFKDSNKQYLSVVIANACKQAEALLKESNETALSGFYKTLTGLEQKAKSNYPPTLLNHMAESAKRTLESSLKFNQGLFEQTIAYHKNLLKK